MVFAEHRHPAYDHLDAKKRAEGRHHTQVGDPIKGAKAMYDLAVMENPPFRIVIGSDAYQVFSSYLSKILCLCYIGHHEQNRHIFGELQEV